MNSDMLLLAERLVLAVETISEDVKNMSAYVYDLNCSVSHFLNNKNGKVGISVVTGRESGSLPFDPPANEEEDFTESKYSLPCEQINGSSVPHMEHEMSVRGVGCISNDRAESSNVLASITGHIKVEEPSESNDNGIDSSSDSGRNIVRDHVADIKDEIDIHEDFFPLPEETDVLVTMRSPEVEIPQRGTTRTPDEGYSANPSTSNLTDDIKDEIDILEDFFPLQEETDVQVTIEAPDLEDCTTDTTRYPDVQDSVPKTQEMLSACGLKGRLLHDNSEETDRADRKLLKRDMNVGEEPPHLSCRDTDASSFCPEENLREQDGKEREDQREKGSGARERGYRAQKKGKASAKKSHSEQSGRQRRNRGPLLCDTCGKSFSFKSFLEIHKRIHTSERPFHCALCNKTCSTKGNLIVHMKVHYEERSYKCSNCKKSFKEKCNLKSHMRLHSGEKPFECSVCKKAFTQSTHLKTHMRTHTAEKPYICRECGKVFTQSGTLTSHMRLHSGEKPFVCTECGKAFTRSGALTRHMRMHSGEKPFVCTECGKAFTRSGALTRHMRLHSGEKPFGCTECGKAFTHMYTLHTHMRTHTGQRPFACKACGSSFTQLSNLKRHKHLVHGVASSVSQGTV